MFCYSSLLSLNLYIYIYIYIFIFFFDFVSHFFNDKYQYNIYINNKFRLKRDNISYFEKKKN